MYYQFYETENEIKSIFKIFIGDGTYGSAYRQSLIK